MLADYHVHTAFSDDSQYPMEAVVQDAIAMGIEELCFTDHVDYGIKRDWDDPRGILYRPGGPGEPERMPVANVDYEKYVDEIRRLQAVYGDQISLKLGMEFGMQMTTVPEYRRLFVRYPFDFILLSVHEIDDQELWTGDYQRGKSQQAYNEGYYEEIWKLVSEYRDYSVLGHLDLITRYDRAGKYPFSKLRPILTEILKTVIRDGKGIEVNTSCYRYGLDDLTPSVEILKLYRQLGGQILTLGSDSHKKAHLGTHIPEARRILKELGYQTFCTYEKMEPRFHPL